MKRLEIALSELIRNLQKDIRLFDTMVNTRRFQFLIFRIRANQNPREHESNLARHAQYLAYTLYRKEWESERLSMQSEAVNLLRSRADRDGRKRSRRALGRVLGEYAIYLRAAGKYGDAKVAQDEYLSIFREYFADGLNQFNTSLNDKDGTPPPQLDPVVLFDRVIGVVNLQLLHFVREKFQRYPGMQILRLADALKRTAYSYYGARDFQNAVSLSTEAVKLYRALVKYDRRHFIRNLCRALLRHSEILEGNKEMDAATEAAQEAVDTYRALAKKDPILRPDLVQSLNRLAGCQFASESASAYTTSSEAVELITEVVEKSESPSSQDQVAALYQYAHVRTAAKGVKEEERIKEALSATEKALEIQRQQVKDEPQRWTDIHVAVALENRALCLRHAKQYDLAVKASDEAVEIWRKRYELSPGTYRHNLAITLSFRRGIMNAGSRYKDALDAVKEEIELLEVEKAECGDRWIHGHILDQAVDLKSG